MIEIQQTYKAHPIGQGFFYTGQLRGGHSEFNFVFDCGSLSYNVLNDTIDRYNKTNQTKDIDLLIISHFDADHVNGLKRLLEGRKVKKVVAPFIGFEQRLSIALNNVEQFMEENISDEEFFESIEGILDIKRIIPDRETEYFFVKDSDTPINPDFRNFDISSNEIDKFEFTFQGETKPKEEDYKQLYFQENESLKVVNCNQIGIIKTSSIDVLSFLFYKKKVGEDEGKFYKNVFKGFLEQNKEIFGQTNPSIDDVIKAIKNYSGATKIKELFEEAAKELNIDLSIKEIKNLNTTALCMMHLDNLRNAVHKQNILDRIHYIEGDYELVQIFNKRELYFPLFRDCFHYHRRFRDGCYGNSNTLLTADSFLKNEDDVNEFIKHYSSFLDEVQFFQVPHHGSRHSSSKLLFGQINSRYNFINYGINHCFIKKWSHPHDEIINELVATGKSSTLIPVNEYSGYQINILIDLS